MFYIQTMNAVNMDFISVLSLSTFGSDTSNFIIVIRLFVIQCTHVLGPDHDSIFHSSFSSTLDLKVDCSRARVAKRLDFLLDFSLDFSTIHNSLTYVS